MTSPNRAIQQKTRFDGHDLREMLSVATELFERNIEPINALNVFPVPDGDTGTNMYLTLRDVLKGDEAARSASASEVASAVARGALMSARGNSGVILSQFFKGLAQGLEGEDEFGSAELARALQSSTELAYAAVGKPVEGTLLTVIASVAEVAKEAAAGGKPLPDLLDAICDSAVRTVALTPTMLPVLREAGVVDAGGQGLSVILQGFRLYARGEGLDSANVETPEPVGVDPHAGVVSETFLAAAEEEIYGYCTQFVLQGNGSLEADAVRQELSLLAHSAVVVGDQAIRVHVHTEDPGPVVSYAVSLGTMGQVKIENMDEQRREYAAARRREVGQVERQEIAVVAVAWGTGLESVFADLGSTVLTAGDTMNPSIKEILDAVESAPADSVIILPNNKNIVPAADQAVEMSGKSLSVVPTTTIPQGIAAMLAFDPKKGLGGSLSEMRGMLSSVRTGEVCEAVRPVQLNGVEVGEGQTIGLLERELVVAGDESTEVLLSLLDTADVGDGALVTLYWGGRLARPQADAAYDKVSAAFPGVEVELVAGGQPHYDYILSIE